MFKNVYKHLMSGVSYMLPFVVGGGILIALGFLFDIGNAGASNYGSGNSVAAMFNSVGGMLFAFMLPVLSGYIAYSIADRPGLVPGFLAGALAGQGSLLISTGVLDGDAVGSGFLGALLGGFVAGYIVQGMKQLTSGFPASLQGLRPILIFPIFGAIAVAIAMEPVSLLMAPVNTGLSNFLNDLSGTSAILLGLVVGAMMAIDMGGPINKAAYVTAVGSLATAGPDGSIIMAAVMVAGMTPPLGIAIATTIFRDKFSDSQREAGISNYVMGLSFITEGAIPFAAANPKAVIPSIVAGSALAGALVGVFGTSSPAPHGGLFVLPTLHNPLGFVIALLAGAALTAVLLGILIKEAAEDFDE